MSTAFNYNIKVPNVSQKPSIYKNSSTYLNFMPFICGAGLAILLWAFPDLNTRIAIILSYYFFIDNPHTYATYVYIRKNRILETKNPYFWSGIILCALPLILFLGQIPFVENNSVRVQVFLFVLLESIVLVNFHRARQHWGILKKESQLTEVLSNYVDRIEQFLILSILLLPYSYIFSKCIPYISYVQNFAIDFNSKLLAIKDLLIIWMSIEITLFVLAKSKPAYEKMGLIKKIITVVRRSFVSVCVLWAGYAFWDESLGRFLFVSNAAITMLMLGVLVKEYRYKFNDRLFFIFKLFLFQVFVTYLAGTSPFSFFHISLANACLHTTQYLAFVPQQGIQKSLERRRDFFLKNLTNILLFSVTLVALLYLGQTVRIEVLVYFIIFVFAIFISHHFYLDSIIWRKDAAKYLAVPE